MITPSAGVPKEEKGLGSRRICGAKRPVELNIVGPPPTPVGSEPPHEPRLLFPFQVYEVKEPGIYELGAEQLLFGGSGPVKLPEPFFSAR